MTLLRELSISENLFYGNIEYKMNNTFLEVFFGHDNQLSGSIPNFSQNNISQICLMNNILKGHLNIVSRPYEIYMTHNNLLSGKIFELNKNIGSNMYYPQKRIMYPVIKIYEKNCDVTNCYVYEANGIYYLNTNLQTNFEEIVYVHETWSIFLVLVKIHKEQMENIRFLS